MPLFSTQQPPLSSSTKAAGASKAQILAIQTEGKTSTLVSNVLSSFQDQINQTASVLRNPPPPLTELGITDSNGTLIGWIGARTVGNRNYEGAWFANLWIGGSDPSSAIISIIGSTATITISDNGMIQILDPNNAVVAEIGTIFDTPIAVTSISNATPPVVTLASAPTPALVSGHSVQIKGNSVAAYNVNAYITVLTPTTFQLNGVTAHGVGTGGICTRYFSGLYGQNLAAGGTNPWDANIQVLDDGAFANIQNTVFSLTSGGITTTINNQTVAGLTGVAGLTIKDNTGLESSALSQSGLFFLDPSGASGAYMIYDPSFLGSSIFLPSTVPATSANGIYLRAGGFPAATNIIVSNGPDKVTIDYEGISGTSAAPFSLDGIGLTFNFKQVVGPRQPAVPTVTGTAGATYTAVEQGLINALIATVQALYTELGTTGHGLLAN